MKIVVRGVNWLGDAVMTTPALQRLREAKPDANITIVTPFKLADLWKHHPCVDDVIAITPEENVFKVGRRLRWGNFDTALVLPNSPRSAIEMWLGKIPQRIGYARPWRNLFLTRAIPPRAGEIKMHKRTPSEVQKLIASNTANRSAIPSSAHHIHQYLHLVAEAFGANPQPVPPRLEVTDSEISAVRRQYQLHENINWLGINPGAEYGPAKRWPKENFAAVVREIAAQPGWGIAFFGGKADVPLISEILQKVTEATNNWPQQPQIMNLAGKTPLRELCVALKICRAVVTNDTGPMHVAAAVGTPVVVPFGSTSPEMTGPGLPGDQQRHRFIQSTAPCSPCFLRECPIDFRCMKEISWMQVVENVFKTTQ